ncbi:MAG TPA: hypothetical protein VNB90_10090 [Cytophagaceae bacterium]|jgi:hypothetical protein|nr:hypothetical protein [Cytophagaceae bacterium]
MKKNLFKAALAFMVVATAVFVSCKKDKKEESVSSDNVTTESNSSQSEFDDMLKISEDAMSDQSQINKISNTNSCVTVTATTGMITLDYGTACVGSDLRTRSGKLIITYTGKYRDPGTVVTITTNNYFVNGKKIDGMRKVTNNGTNTAGNLVYSVVDSDVNGTANGYATITDVDLKTTTWRSSRTREFAAGASTPLNLLDDEYLINGSADGMTKEGMAYSMTATNIRIKIACWASRIFYPVSGILSITATDGTRSIDYGNGDCDRTIQYTHTNGKTYTFTLAY